MESSIMFSNGRIYFFLLLFGQREIDESSSNSDPNHCIHFYTNNLWKLRIELFSSNQVIV